MNLQEIPLNKLDRHPDNVRKMKASGITELAASIERDGLLQNLTVVEGLSKGKHLVIAGGRRLAALQLLAKDKKIPPTFAVPCLVVTAADAEAVSLAENQMREQMHPIDQFVAFNAQVDAGQPIPDVAARFGVTETFVKQRLKLASVSTKLLDAYRNGDMTLEQLQAFTVTDDHARQETVWKEVKGSRWNDGPDDIKGELLEAAVSAKDARLKFVGEQAYAKAGGAIIKADLFASDDDDSETLSDPALLDRLAMEKLLKRAAKLKKDEGLAWCEAMVDFNFYDSPYGRVPTVVRDMTDAEAKQHAELESQLETLQKQLNKVQDADELDEDEEEKLIDAMDELEQQRDAIDESCTIPHPDAMQYAGAVVSIDSKGKIEIKRNLIRNEHLKLLKPKESTQKKASTDTDAAEDSEPVATTSHSEKLVRRLTAHKTAILRNEILKRGNEGIAIMVYHMLVEDIGDDLSEAHGPLTMTSRQLHWLDREADDIESSEAYQQFELREQELLAPIREHLAAGNDDLYEFIASQTTDYLSQLLTLCVAKRADLVVPREDHFSKSHRIASDFLVNTTTADYWKPTRESYLNHVSKAQIIAAVTEACGDSQAAQLSTMKKDAAAERAEQMLKDTGWLPAPLRAGGDA